jgi:hypothetical protein
VIRSTRVARVLVGVAVSVRVGVGVSEGVCVAVGEGIIVGVRVAVGSAVGICVGSTAVDGSATTAPLLARMKRTPVPIRARTIQPESITKSQRFMVIALCLS